MKPVNPDWSHDEIMRRFCYDPETGVITTRVASGRHGCWIAGRRVGSAIPRKKTGRIYRAVSVTVDGRPRIVLEHRFIWFCMTGRWPVDLIDHKNGDGTDNRWCNLRECSQSSNLGNIRRNRRNTSGIKGVSWYKPTQKWTAAICKGGKTKRLGYFDTIEGAAEAYRKAAERLFGEFARAA